MEVRQGYKQTEVGEIPREWDILFLGEFFLFKNGLNKAKEFFGYGTPIVNYMDVYRHPGLFSHNLDGRVDVNKQELKAFEVRRGDVFFTRTSETVEEVGITSVMLDESLDTVFSGFVLRARPKDDRLADQFMKYCFSSSIVRKQITSKSTYTTRALTNGRALSAVAIACPPKPEQCAIAAALSDVDALISGLESLVAKKRDLKQAAMQQLLTGKQRLPGFSVEWEKKKLGTILSYEQPTKYLVISSEYNDNNDITVLTANKSFILGYTDESDNVFENIPVVIFDDFTTASKYVDFSFKVKSSALKILKPKNENSDLRFIFWKMQLIRFPLGGHKRYWISEYQHLEIEVPSLEEQTAIAAVLSNMDAEIAALEQKRDKTRALKQGMMHELLTGRIRLI